VQIVTSFLDSLLSTSEEFDFALHTGVAKNPRRTGPGPIYTIQHRGVQTKPSVDSDTTTGRVRRRVPLVRSQVLEVPVYVVTASKANASLHFLHFQKCPRVVSPGQLHPRAAETHGLVHLPGQVPQRLREP